MMKYAMNNVTGTHLKRMELYMEVIHYKPSFNKEIKNFEAFSKLDEYYIEKKLKQIDDCINRIDEILIEMEPHKKDDEESYKIVKKTQYIQSKLYILKYYLSEADMRPLMRESLLRNEDHIDQDRLV